MEKIFTSPEETQTFAQHLGQLCVGGEIIFLNGDLGAGKTTFTKGFARGLDISAMIKSPSYTIIREYENGRLPFYHMDLYRLAGDNDELGLEEYFQSSGVTVIEWGNLLEDLPADFLTITFEKTGEESRKLILTAHGLKSEKFLEKVEASQWN
ncbi:tRNA (adenosine(37)-N6)-threonylcarbamoyltransferase complex ATPase subunit type 1 TsaE [Enterococcus timonensis]|uniref:tRNA (adenosine(37)-N6)-threonylcarbamoyltransferase complex ATPase subunit type 1 TsaE n=1 Tax=Enterococcus timonensis TaxID=1852364 RepID=UPI0008DA36FD|nr:tRNA (adenosine(37)-N6)-threonylcarbamoyltransferase complex ATPase subunit type 1 TsaE [Enterococcus timonensis]